MLLVNEAFLKTEFDKLALDHLWGIGAIVERVDRPPHKAKSPKIPKGRVGWKSLPSMRGGGCIQCGDAPSQVPGGLPESKRHDLCNRCFAVLVRSEGHWVANGDVMNTSDWKISESEAKERCLNRINEQNNLFPAHQIPPALYVRENWKIVAKLGILKQYSNTIERIGTIE